MAETCCDSNHCYGKYGMNTSEGTFILQRVKTSSMFLLVSKCWYEVPEAQIAGNWERTFWKIFSQPFQLSEENVKPGPAGHSATIILCSQTAGTLKFQWHLLFWAKLFHKESQLPKYALITMWKDHQYPFLWSWNTCDSRPRHKLQLQWNQACELTEDSPATGTEFNIVDAEKEHGPACLGLCSLDLHHHTSRLVFWT